MKHFRDAEIWELAKKQHGVVAYWQLAGLGVTRRVLWSRRRSSEWIRVLPSVARMAWAEETWLQRVWTAWLWAGPLAVLSHFTAAALNGVATETGSPIELTLPARFTLGSRSGWVTTYRTRRLKPAEVEKIAGLPVTSAVRTLVDLSAVLTPEQLEKMVQLALRSNAVTKAALTSHLGRGTGRHGFKHFRKVVEAM